MNDNGGEWVESMGVAGGRGQQEAGVARKIIGIKARYYFIKIHFKINSIIYCIRVYID